MEYSWTVRLRGEKIAFVSDEHVKAVMLGQGGQGAAAQRRRWEFGRSELKKRLFGPIVRSRYLNPVEKLTSLIELTMPSMVAMAGVYLCLLTLNGWVAFRFPQSVSPTAYTENGANRATHKTTHLITVSTLDLIANQMEERNCGVFWM